jgi:hypothetical protein
MRRKRSIVDHKPGPPPEIRTDGDNVVFMLTLADGSQGERLVLRCARDGDVWVSIQPSTSVDKASNRGAD